MAKYLITGVAGFIGSTLARALLERGEYVRGIDNLSTGRRENITAIENRIDFRCGDILNKHAIADACTGIDFVMHLAAIPSVAKSVADPFACNQAAVDGTLNVLVAARDAHVRRIVYAASSSAYGETRTLPKREDVAPDPISPYAVAKLAGEMYMKAFYRCYGLETVTLRYFNIFGPRQDPTSPYSGVLAKFITSMLEGRAPAIYGDGEQSRDFTYVDNAVQANLKACLAPAERCAGRCFNIACGERTSLNRTYQLLQQMTGFCGSANYGPDRAGDIKHSLADIGAARDALGYDPQVDFAEGLRRAVAWYRENMHFLVSGQTQTK